jgi:hypothetical protein
MVATRDLYVLVCVSVGLLWYCVVMACGFLADLLCVLYFVYLRFWYVSSLEQVLVGTPSHYQHGQFQTGVGRSCKACNGL